MNDNLNVPLLSKNKESTKTEPGSSGATQASWPVDAAQRHSKSASGRHTDAVIGEGYQTGVCDCCAEPGGMKLCCYGFCCAPCLFGQNVEEMGPTRWSGKQADPFVIPCWAACLTFGVLGVLHTLPALAHKGTCELTPILQVLLRRRIRRHYKIQGHSKQYSCPAVPCGCFECTDDDCADCCSAYWCTPCALCQDAREIQLRGSTAALTLPEPVVTPPSSQTMS